MYLATLGHRVSWASRVGDDPLGERLIAQLKSQGVDTSRVIRDSEAPTGVYFKDPRTDGSVVYYYRRGSAASRMSASDAPAFLPPGCSVLHLSGITPALSDSCRSLVESLVDMAKLRGITVSFDVNYRRKLWSVDTAAHALLALSGRADVVFVGLDEAAELWGTKSPRDVRDRIGHENWLVVKNAAVGATEFRGSTETFEPAQEVHVVDQVGAGDAFAAGYLSGLLRGAGPRERLRQGHALAAKTLITTGDFLHPTAPEAGKSSRGPVRRSPAGS